MNYYSKKTVLGYITVYEEDSFVTAIRFENKEGGISNPFIEKVFAELEEYFSGKRKSFTVNIKPKGTEFQMRVWRELIKIPYGATKSYKEIAQACQNPSASRAVGNANNKNPIPVIIPCHRVIGANGNLTGYAGGIKVKEKLLALEKKFL